ncbi:hypothetical protein KBY28_07750 [Ruegeria pomeroyi]|uniref:hypothetical protein n=1 Tax=Ruegeria pomeroyi TaxID=89184 RepID=UPI001F4027A2|nr:hypothetical protein [Ruegeria pomeroyi]MCE8508343.1 hypothetical protein [Ruegeria pomeroyi]
MARILERSPYRFDQSVGSMPAPVNVNSYQYRGYNPIDLNGLSTGRTSLPFDMGTPVGQTTPTKTTGIIDGGSKFLDALSGFAVAALQNIGAQPEPTHATMQPVAYTPSSGGGVNMPMLFVVGAVGVGLYLALKS